jgi:hypothetical protein
VARVGRFCKCLADGICPGSGAGGFDEAGSGDGGHIHETFEAGGEDRQAGRGGLGGGDAEAFRSAGHGDVGSNEKVGAGVKAVDGMGREPAEET